MLMGRVARPALKGLKELGARLRELRGRAGISQMKLSEKLGFDPTHGYKYVLRIEKGLVPNPTLRTISGYLEACGAGWPDVADVLPWAGGLPRRDQAPAPAEAAPAPAQPPPVIIEHVKTPEPPRRRDSRPLRERLRSQRIEQHTDQTRQFWSAVSRAEARVHDLLHRMRIPIGTQRGYIAFVRATCSTIATRSATRPGAAAADLSKLAATAGEAGLDRKVLTHIQEICVEVLSADAAG
jgi:transcriptional regulator with XRE-family HTH domain